MIKAVILDAYGTVFSTGTGSVDMMTEILKLNGREDLDPAAVYSRFKRLHREHADEVNAAVSADPDAFLSEAELFEKDLTSVYAEYGLARDPAADIAVMLSIQGTRVAYPDSRAAIEDMRKLVKVVIGSTTDTAPLLKDLERAGIETDGIFTSESLRLYKPARGFYVAILDALGISPFEALFAGDSPRDDVEGPAAAGLVTCLVDRKALGAGSSRPDFAVSSLAELAGILRTLV